MTEKTDKCEFEKKITINENIFDRSERDVDFYIHIFTQLLYYMKETNKLHKRDCEFFRFTYRPSRPDESPHDTCTAEFRWGHKE